MVRDDKDRRGRGRKSYDAGGDGGDEGSRRVMKKTLTIMVTMTQF